MRLVSTDRTAVSAWGPLSSRSYLAAGTAAGALDASFSTNAELEIFALGATDGNYALNRVASVSSPARFQRLAWSHRAPETADSQFGVLAAGLENGVVDLYHAGSLLNGDGEKARFARNDNHKAAVRGLDFNTVQESVLASGAADGEILIWDMSNPTKPYTPGTRSSKLVDITSLAWNRQFSHILASTSSNGYTVVWDLKNKREVIALASPVAKQITSAVWNPSMSTQIITASEDDREPALLVWDLRNARAPERTLPGHSKGVLCLSWCPRDPSLLISGGKDNRVLCWNPQTSELLGELTVANNWVFDVQWNTRNPGIVSTSSFDGQLSVHRLTTTSSLPGIVPVYNSDPFGSTVSTASGESLAVKQPPQWFRRGAGAAWAFGGRLVTFGANKEKPHNVSIHSVVTEHELVTGAIELESLAKANKFEQLCDSKIATEKLSAEERFEWQLIKVHQEGDQRTKVAALLGFTADELQNKIKTVKPSSAAAATATSASAETESAASEHTDEAGDLFGETSGAADDVFSPIMTEQAMTTTTTRDTPFALQAGNADDVTRVITEAVILGDFAAAVQLCLAHDRAADALVLAFTGGEELYKQTQETYLSKATTAYLRITGAVARRELNDVVAHGDLQDWRAILATVCTFAKSTEFEALSAKLGERLHRASQRHPATLCFIVAGDVSKAADLWLEAEPDGNGQDGQAETKRLQSFVERVAALRSVVGATDKRLTGQAVVRKFSRYAEILAANGQRDTAQFFLSFVEGENATTVLLSERLAVANQPREPVAKAPQTKAVPQSTQPTQLAYQPAAYQPAQPAYQPPQPAYQPTQPAYQPTQPAYQPAQASFQAPPPQQHFSQTPSAYQPAYPQPAPVTRPPVTPAMYMPAVPPATAVAPVFNATPTPSMPLASAPTSPPKPAGSWNDAPYVAPKKPVGAVPPSAVAPPPAAVTAQMHAAPMNVRPAFQVPPPGPAMTAPMNPMGNMMLQQSAPMNEVPRASAAAAAARPAAAPAPAPAPPKKKVTGDRSKLEGDELKVFSVLSPLMARCDQSAQKRLNDLFDKLNDKDIPGPVLSQLVEITRALEQRNYDGALQLHLTMVTSNLDGVSTWHTGVKQLIGLLKQQR